MSSQQNTKPILLAAVGMLVAMGAAGYVLMSAAPETNVAAAPMPEPVVDREAAPPPRAIDAPAPLPTTTADRPESSPSREPRKQTRLARDLTREQVWSALGRKHNLEPAAPGSAAPSESAAALLPTLDKDYVRGSIKDQLVPVAIDCYTTVLERDPELAGSLVFNFTIIGDEEIGGVVEAVEIAEESTFDDEFLRECLSESLLAVTFPPPPDGGRVEVSYPIHFEPE